MTSNKINLLGMVTMLSVSMVAQATVIRYETLLASEPSVTSDGTGSARVTYDSVAQTLRVQISFADLVAGTTVAHIHAPTAEPGVGNVGVAVHPGTFPGFPAGVTSGTYDQTFDLKDSAVYTGSFFTTHGGGTVAGSEAALAAAMAEGKAYVNVHTTQYPAGEIRGFLARASRVPDASSTAMLLFLSLFGLSAVVRRQRRTA
jgi:hypothetical protein